MMFAAAMALVLAACATTTPPLGGAPGVEVSDTATLPAPTFEDFGPEPDEGLIRPLDVIQVDVFGIEELSRVVRVGTNGTFDYPLIGSVEASGLTTDELSYQLENRLRDTYVRNPDVTSQITARNEQFFTIGGEIDRPGRFPITSTVTLMEAVAIGGGFDEYANQSEVLVFRTVEGQRYIGVYNLQGIQRGNYPDPVIYPRDIVMVGDSPSRRRLDTILALVPTIIQPLILLERVAN